MSFGNPIWLWGLTGLLIPIGIHLLSLKEGKTIHIGSVRHLRESNTAQFSSIRLNEILLLLIRCLMVILLVLLLSGFQVNIGSSSAGKWLVIDWGIEKESSTKELLDSLQRDGYEVHFLSKNFPLLKDSANVVEERNYWSLVSELNSVGTEDIIVISYNFSKNFKGERISKPEKIRWITIPSSKTKYITKSIQLNPDSAWIREASSSTERTSLTSRISRTNKGVEMKKSIRISIYTDDAFLYDEKIVLASLKAIEKSTPYAIIPFVKKAGEFAEDPNDWIIWLSNKKIETKNPNLIMYATCSSNLNLLERSGVAALYCNGVSNTAWVITEKLNEENAIRENFTISLADILINEEMQNEKAIRAEPEQRLWSTLSLRDDVRTGQDRSNLAGIISIIFVLTLISERVLAIKKNQ